MYGKVSTLKIQNFQSTSYTTATNSREMFNYLHTETTGPAISKNDTDRTYETKFHHFSPKSTFSLRKVFETPERSKKKRKNLFQSARFVVTDLQRKLRTSKRYVLAVSKLQTFP